MRKAATFSEEETKRMIRAYVDEKRPMVEIMREFKAARNTIKHVLMENGVALRTPGSEPSIKDLVERDYAAGETDVDKLAEKYGASRDYVRSCLSYIRRRADTKESIADTEVFLSCRYGDYLTLDKLKDFADSVHVGDRINMRANFADAGHSTYMYDNPSLKKIVVTVKAKYPNFALTDHGAKLWVDLWDAVRRYGWAR